jgi:hypothetical protein
MTCDLVDRLMTPFVDGECAEDERAAVIAHLRGCAPCTRRVEAESTARQLLHAHASVARTMGVEPEWRPRVWRLGRPMVPASAAALLLAGALGGVLLAAWLRPAPVLAVGVIGDSRCQHEHRPAARFAVDEGTCTRNCVAAGAEYVLVTDTRIFRISNQDLADLPALADVRVAVRGRMNGDMILVARLDPAE